MAVDARMCEAVVEHMGGDDLVLLEVRPEVNVTGPLGVLHVHQGRVHPHGEGQVSVWRVVVETAIKPRIDQDVAVCRMFEMERHDGIFVPVFGMSMGREALWLRVVLQRSKMCPALNAVHGSG